MQQCYHETAQLLKADNVQALLSVYADEGLVTFSPSETAGLEHARQLAEAQEQVDGALRISGCIQLPGVKVEGHNVTIRFTLPVEYPIVKPALQLIANAPRCTSTSLCVGMRSSPTRQRRLWT